MRREIANRSTVRFFPLAIQKQEFQIIPLHPKTAECGVGQSRDDRRFLVCLHRGGIENVVYRKTVAHLFVAAIVEAIALNRNKALHLNVDMPEHGAVVGVHSEKDIVDARDGVHTVFLVQSRVHAVCKLAADGKIFSRTEILGHKSAVLFVPYNIRRTAVSTDRYVIPRSRAVIKPLPHVVLFIVLCNHVWHHGLIEFPRCREEEHLARVGERGRVRVDDVAKGSYAFRDAFKVSTRVPLAPLSVPANIHRLHVGVVAVFLGESFHKTVEIILINGIGEIGVNRVVRVRPLISHAVFLKEPIRATLMRFR